MPVAPATEKTFGGNIGSQLSFTATMTAPAAAGTYTYTVWTNQGPTDGSARVGTAVYTITVALVVPTPPPTTAPPVITTTAPPPPPVSRAHISGLSPDHGVVGTTVTIRGAGLGRSGPIRFGTVTARASSWTRTSIVVKVPGQAGNLVSSKSASEVPVWYGHAQILRVTVTPSRVAASKVVSFRLDAGKLRGEKGRDDVRGD